MRRACGECAPRWQTVRARRSRTRLLGFDEDVLNAGRRHRSLDPLVVGGLVERRIIGEVYVGAWGLSNASGGVAVTVGF